MRNKILVIVWMVLGAYAALWIGMLPMVLGDALLTRFVGKHSPVHVMFELSFTLVTMACGATWFKKLFYKGMLWGYKPDKD